MVTNPRATTCWPSWPRRSSQRATTLSKVNARRTSSLDPCSLGENGKPTVEYDVDAFHPVHQVVLEIEAGRGAASNADFRDIVRSSLLVGVRYLALAMMIEYRGGGRPIKSYENTRNSSTRSMRANGSACRSRVCS